MWTLAIILFMLWFFGFVVFHVAGALIHLLLLAAAVVFIWRLVAGGTAARTP